MITKAIETGLAVLGALIVFVGFASALNTAFAAGANDIDENLKTEISITS